MRIALLVLATGCRSVLGFEDPKPIDAGSTSDGPSIDAPADCRAWQPRHFDPCEVGAPGETPTFEAGVYRYDTTDRGGRLQDPTGAIVASSDLVIRQSDGTEVALWNVGSLIVPETVVIEVIGSKPLLVASWSEVSIDGRLDAGSVTAELDPAGHVDGTVRLGGGAGVGCEGRARGNQGVNAMSSGGSGGGGGGAFEGNGGSGGAADNNPAISGGLGGANILPPAEIRGGCRGGASGTAGIGAQPPSTPMTASSAGDGGGALVIAARAGIVVHKTGSLVAGGGGGAGAPEGSSCGGGGGGAGGTIGLDALEITINGDVAANGGGGGGAAPYAGNGNQGFNGTIGIGRTPGGAAQATACGQRGGAGGARTSNDGETPDGLDSCGGGGGGGGAGFVLFWNGAPGGTGTISPAPIAGP